MALTKKTDFLDDTAKTQRIQYSPNHNSNTKSYNDYEFKELKLENKQLKKFIDGQANNMTRLQTNLKLNQEKLYIIFVIESYVNFEKQKRNREDRICQFSIKK